MEVFVNSAVALVISLITFAVCAFVEHITKDDREWSGEKTTLNKVLGYLGMGCLAFAGLCFILCICELVGKALDFLWDNIFVYAAFLMLSAGAVFLIYRFFRYILELFKR